MPNDLSISNSRFRLEAHDKSGNYLATLPYRNAQADFLLNEKGAALRIEVPYRGYYSIVNFNTLYPAKTEMWLYDNQVSATDPIFAGLVWDATPSSSTGVLSVSAQDHLSYLSKRVLKIGKTYSNTQAADDMVDLLTYVNSGGYKPQFTVVKQSSNTKTSSKSYKSYGRYKILDLLASTAALDDGTEFYCRMVNGSPTIYIYGGLIKPTTPANNVLEYGGSLDGYSAQFNAQAINNDVDAVGSNNRVGNYQNATKIAEYGNSLFTEVINTDQTASTSLVNTATQQVKANQSTKIIPSLVTRRLIPIRDFDFGSQFIVVISDDYVQVNQTIRTVGWQLTIGQGDLTTTVIYTKDNEEVS